MAMNVSLIEAVTVATSIQKEVFDTDLVKQSLLSMIDSNRQTDKQSGFCVTSLANLGAVVEFTGFVRADKVEEGREPVKAIELEHYPAMTEKALSGLIEQAVLRFDCLAIALIHRVGLIHVGEPIVYVVVMSSHRKDSFSCAQFLMDYLKRDIPLWKREYFSGDSRWVDQKTSDIAAQSRWD